MIKKILVGVGRDPESDVALSYAGKLSLRIGAEVTAMHIVKQEPIPSSWPIKEQMERDLENERLRITQVFTEIREKEDLPNIRFKKVIKGNPADYLIEESEQQDYDLIVIGHRDLPNIKKLFLGSVSSKVVQYAHVSVLVAKEFIGPSKVLFCIDGSTCSERALRFGGHLIQSLGCRATVLNVAPWIIDESEVLAREVAEEGAEILRDLRIDASSKAVCKKEIAKEILKEAEEGAYDLIVVGSRGLSGIHRFLIGSTTLKLINQTSKPILVYKHHHQTT